MKTTRTPFGAAPDGSPVWLFTVESSRGMSFSAMSYGATLVSVMVPDRAGRTENVILGFDDLAGYLAHGDMYSGALVGRFAGRIARGRFRLEGRDCAVTCNDVEGVGPDGIVHHQHGGARGFDKVVWKAGVFSEKGRAGIRWSYVSRDGEEGFPGRVRVRAAYSLSEDNELAFEYLAVADRATPINLTNHSYWNLGGSASPTILDQELAFNCPFYMVADSSIMPTGEVLKTAGTPFDFSAPKPIGRDIGKVPGGYDHCLIVGKPLGELGRVCTARDPASGRSMEVISTSPCVVFYTSNSLNGRPHPKHGAFCLETQFPPDDVNFSHFTSCVALPGRPWRHRTLHRFGA